MINGDPPGDIPLNQGTPFTDSNPAFGGLTAAFSCSSDAQSGGCMTIDPTGLVSWGPEMLLVTNFPSTLTIQFNQIVTAISMDFGAFTADPLVLTAFTGGPTGTQVGSNSVAGSQVASNQLFEGTISFNSVNFDTIVLDDSQSSVPIFGIGNINVTTAASASVVPEPASLGMLAAAGLAFAMRKRIARLGC